MAKFVKKLQQKFGFLGEQRIDFISHALVGEMLDNLIRIMETSKERHESGVINVDWNMTSARDV